MISTLIFDLGNVFVQVHRQRLIQNFLNELTNHYDFQQLQQAMKVSPTLRAYELGKLNSEQFAQALNRELGISLATETVKRCWQDMFTPISENIAQLPHLKQMAQLGMISDTNPWHIEIIRQDCDIFRHFNALIFSYEVQLAKPDRRIFEIALERLNAAPEQCAYIDDMQQNVAAARQLGMHGIICTTPSDLKTQLKKFGLSL